MLFITGFVLLILNIVTYVNGLGCIAKLCAGPTKDNQIANEYHCDDKSAHCGKFGGRRSDSRLVKGVDIQCEKEQTVYAPFDGTISFYRPRGGQNSSHCIDMGLQIEGTGEWRGYVALMAYFTPRKYSGEVKSGDVIGTSVDLKCAPNNDVDNHILIQLIREGKLIDPTFHLTECMCTGLICESNKINEIVGEPQFKHKAGFGKGIELKCPMSQNDQGVLEAPVIRSPISAEYLGRFRPTNATVNNNFACDNDGIVLKGSNNWRDFTVHIYNVQFTMEPGERKEIEQGDPIARRLNCPDKNNDFVFVEFRHKGRLVNLANLVTDADCKLPNLPD